MNIRQATTRDASDLQKINDTYFGETRDYKKEIESKDTLVFLCEDEDKIIGISGLKRYAWNNTAWILNIFVLPEMRNKGIAKQIILCMVEEAKKMNARCVLAEAPSNGNAPFLFMACKFRKCGYNDRYYANDGGEIAEFYSFDL